MVDQNSYPLNNICKTYMLREIIENAFCGLWITKKVEFRCELIIIPNSQHIAAHNRQRPYFLFWFMFFYQLVTGGWLQEKLRK